MANADTIRTDTAAQLEARRQRRESRTDLAKVRPKSDAELEADIAADPDFRDVPPGWHVLAAALMPSPKKLLSLRLDADVIEWFKRQGPGYQTRMNAVLRAYVSLDGKT